MSSILVWVFVTCGGYGNGNCTYSPPHATKESCEFMAAQIKRGICIGMYANKEGR